VRRSNLLAPRRLLRSLRPPSGASFPRNDGLINMNDTIAAISTPPGEAGLGIVRISGKAALKIADRIFKPKSGKKASGFKTYTVHYGHIMDKNETIDEAILTLMRSPKSFTRENIVEISCHGGIIVLRKVLNLVLENGARIAEPGEFTKRAFLNGRIDLAQSEAVIDVIRAKTDSALKIGAEQLKGVLSNQVNNLRDGLLGALTALEANIDFPDEEIGKADLKKIKDRLKRIESKLKNILDNSNHGRVLREGIHIVICGRPNVGKSSLLNALLKQERSIVTPIAGTTRDTIEEIIDIKGIPVRIVDTAGLIEPRDLIEKKAIQRSKKHIEAADLVMILFDASRKLSSQDNALITKLNKKPAIAVINKIDLKQKIEHKKLEARFKNVIQISAKRGSGIDILEDAIADFVYAGKSLSREHIIVSNMRHITLLKESKKFIENAIKAVDRGLEPEFIAQDIKDSLNSLDDILGKRFSDKLLDNIFNEFCIGK